MYTYVLLKQIVSQLPFYCTQECLSYSKETSITVVHVLCDFQSSQKGPYQI